MTLDNTIEEFVSWLVRIGRSPETAKKYRKDIRQFVRWSKLNAVEDLSREHVCSWMTEMRNRNYSDGSVANQLWALKAFLKFAREEKKQKCWRFDMTIPRPAAPEVVEFMEPEELKVIFGHINTEDIHGLRLRTFIEVMINTGMRPSECLARNRDDFVAREIEIVGKGKKKRKVYINDRTRHWIDRYLAKRKDSHEAMFVTHCTARRMTLRHTEYNFQQAVKKARFGKKVVLHTLRHTYATTLLFNGCPLPYVSSLLGHSKIETTRRHYLAIRQKHAKEAHFRYLSYEQKPVDKYGDNDVNNFGDNGNSILQTL